MKQNAKEVEIKRSGISFGIKVQHTVYIRGVTKSTKFEFQSGKLVNIFYFKL